MDLKLAGKTAIVTGAGRGIGLATVRALTAEGVRVAAASRTITPELAETGALPVPADLSTAAGTARMVEEAIAGLGGVDLLVNNVGGGDRVELNGFLAVDDAEWEANFDLTLYSAIRVSRAALPSLLERRGAIVNVSSIGARQPSAGPIAYNVAKAALTAFGKALAEEVGPQGVRVNTVSPGPVRTALWEAPGNFGSSLAAAFGADHAEFLTRVPEVMGMVTGRFIEPEEVAALIAFLLSGAAASVTGSDHLIDGGVIKTA